MVKLNGLIKSNDLNHGAYEWNASQTYNVPAMVFGSDGNLYRALKASINKNPVSNPDVWEDIIKKINDSINETIIKVRDSAFPIGGICAWPSLSNFPMFGITWFECDGSEYDTTEYPELYSILHTNILPDYRGVFLRGYGSHVSTHYGNITHASGNVNELQGDAIRNISGWMASERFSFQTSGAFYYSSSGRRSNVVEWFDSGSGQLNFAANRVVPVANENRPINKAVRWLIKAE